MNIQTSITEPISHVHDITILLSHKSKFTPIRKEREKIINVLSQITKKSQRVEQYGIEMLSF